MGCYGLPLLKDNSFTSPRLAPDVGLSNGLVRDGMVCKFRLCYRNDPKLDVNTNVFSYF